MADKPQETKQDENKSRKDARLSEIDKRSDLSKDEKEILKQYEEGVHVYQIAKNVYKFVNQDTVGSVVLTTRKEYANDYNEVEDVNSTKGYSGIK